MLKQEKKFEILEIYLFLLLGVDFHALICEIQNLKITFIWVRIFHNSNTKKYSENNEKWLKVDLELAASKKRAHFKKNAHFKSVLGIQYTTYEY